MGKSGENCYSTGCCQVSGHKCYTKSFGVAQCNETCTPGLKGFSCGVVGSHSVPVATKLEGKKLYCFAVYTKNTGSTKKSYELDLLQVQKKSGVSIFACEAWDVFSDVADAIDGSYSMIPVEDAFGEFHQIKRKTGVWVNWGMFYQVKVEAWDLTTDGACESDRPEGEKKNKKWHAPDCSAVTTPAAHPFKKPDEYMKCMSGMT